MGKKLLSLDALLLFLLVLVRVRIDTLAIAVIPRPTELVAQVPILGGLLSSQAQQLLTDWMADPISSLLIAATFGLTIIYLMLDIWENWPRGGTMKDRSGMQNAGDSAFDRQTASNVERSKSIPHSSFIIHISTRRFYWAKLITLYLIIFLITGVSTLLVVGLRHVTEPARYAHDGGVLMTESAMDFILAGKNPYVETYRGTPMEQAFPNGPGLSHYPYLPWTFLSSIPFYLAGKNTLGWYDQRFVYLLVFALTLALVPKLAKTPRHKLALVMLIGLNPIMGNDIVYGMNDVFVAFWLILAAYLLQIDQPVLATASLGLAVATKGTVWPILPFYLMYVYRDELVGFRAVRLSMLCRLLPLIIVPLVIVLPFAVWNFGAMVDDTWRYNMGSAVIDPLPIKGWGLANVILALGLVQDTMAPFPFWIFEALVALPVLVVLLLRQCRCNTLDNLLLSYGVFLLVFVFVSRTMNANYLGFALTFVAAGFFAESAPRQ